MNAPVMPARECQLDIAELRAAYRSGELTPVRVVRAHLDRIAAIDPTILAYIALCADRAIAEAEASSERWRRGGELDELDGIPVAVKDLFAVEGVPLTGGSARSLPTSSGDAEAVHRLRTHGAIILGTNTLHEFAFGGTSVNAHTGTPRNPRDPSLIAGGSSGGSAAAVAAGLAVAALGTETGNSVRRPAAFCGVVGFKPTFGRVSRRGVLPLAPSLDHVGAFARSVLDVATIIGAVSGPDGADPWSRVAPRGFDGAPADATGMRIGVPSGLVQGTSPEIETAFRAAIERLRARGAVLVEIDLPVASRWTAIASSILMHAEAAVVHAARFDADPGSYGDDVAARILSGRAFTAEDLARAHWLRAWVRSELEGAFGPTGSIDVIVAPAVRATAPSLAPGAFVAGDAPWSVEVGPFHLQRLPSLLGLPSGSVPVGWSEGGLPLPLMAIGPAWGDGAVLGVLEAVAVPVPVASPGPARG